MSEPAPVAIANALDGYIGTDWRNGVFKGVLDGGGASETYENALNIDGGIADEDFGDDDDDVTCVEALT